jgi:hypothetical protein
LKLKMDKSLEKRRKTLTEKKARLEELEKKREH